VTAQGSTPRGSFAGAGHRQKNAGDGPADSPLPCAIVAGGVAALASLLFAAEAGDREERGGSSSASASAFAAAAAAPAAAAPAPAGKAAGINRKRPRATAGTPSNGGGTGEEEDDGRGGGGKQARGGGAAGVSAYKAKCRMVANKLIDKLKRSPEGDHLAVVTAMSADEREALAMNLISKFKHSPTPEALQTLNREVILGERQALFAHHLSAYPEDPSYDLCADEVLRSLEGQASVDGKLKVAIFAAAFGRLWEVIEGRVGKEKVEHFQSDLFPYQDKGIYGINPETNEGLDESGKPLKEQSVDMALMRRCHYESRQADKQITAATKVIKPGGSLVVGIHAKQHGNVAPKLVELLQEGVMSVTSWSTYSPHGFRGDSVSNCILVGLKKKLETPAASSEPVYTPPLPCLLRAYAAARNALRGREQLRR